MEQKNEKKKKMPRKIREISSTSRVNDPKLSTSSSSSSGCPGQRLFGANNLQISEVDAFNLVGSIIEKGISENLESNSFFPTHPPKVSVLPFPVARHRSHGPHWGPVNSKLTGDDEDYEDDEEDDLTNFDPVSAFAKPVQRKQKKGLDLSRWREIIPSDDSLETGKIENNRLRSKKAGKQGKDEEAVGNADRKNMSCDLSLSNEAAMELEVEPKLRNADIELHTSAVDMEKDASYQLQGQDNARDGRSGTDQVPNTSTMVARSGLNSFGNEQPPMSLESEIDAENRARLQSMSAEEIAEAQAEIMAKMNPALINLLKKRGQQILKGQDLSRSDEGSFGQKISDKCKDLLTKESNVQQVQSHNSEVAITTTSKDTKNEINNGSRHDQHPDGGSLWNTWSGRVEAVRGLRFSLEGTVIANDPVRGNIAIDNRQRVDSVAERDFLRTEGDPGAVGYTIQEAVQLTRSVIPGQRALALHLIASVLNKAIHNIQQNPVGFFTRNATEVDKLVDWEAIWAFALGPEPELVLSLRMCLDDNHSSVVLACSKVIQCILTCDLNEIFFDITEKMPTINGGIFTAPVFRSKPEVDTGFLRGGFWKYNTKPSNILALTEDIVDNESEGQHTIQDDIVVAGQDFAAGLVRMGILPRMRYLLETDQNPALEECIISILIAIARHSPTCANAVMKCKRLVHVVVDRFMFGQNIEIHPSKIKAVTLLKVLAQSEQKNCIELIKKGYFETMTWHLYRYTSSVDQWIILGKEKCILSSALMVEQLRFWRVCIHYGCCISYFSDIFPALCLWMNPPTFKRLQDCNVLSEFASISTEVYLVLEALARKLSNFYSQKHVTNQSTPDSASEELETWSWRYITPVVDSALKWIVAKNDPYVSKLFERQNGDRSDLVFEDLSVRYLLWVYSAIMHMFSTLLRKLNPEDHTGFQRSGRPVPWLPEFVPKVGLGIIKNRFLSFSSVNGAEQRKDFLVGGSFVEELYRLRQQGEQETSLASVCCLHGLLQVVTYVENLIQLSKKGIGSPPSEGQSISQEEEILDDGMLKRSIGELRCVLGVFMKLVESERHYVQSVESYGRGGPAPGVGLGWGASGGGLWSLTVLLAQTDATLLISILEIFQARELQVDEDMSSNVQWISSVLGVCLTNGPRDRTSMEKALDMLLQAHVLKYLNYFTQQFFQSNKRLEPFGWEYNAEDFELFSKLLASHFKARWLSVKKKAKAVDNDNSSGSKTSKKVSFSLDTIHEKSDASDMTYQDQCCTSHAVEWAHQRLPLPMHWFLSPLTTISDDKHAGQKSAFSVPNLAEDSTETLEAAKAGFFFLLGLEAMSCSLSMNAPSPVQIVPLVWKLHSLSVMLLVGMGLLEDDRSRDVYKALQDLYGQLLDEARCMRSAEQMLEDNPNLVPDNGKKSQTELLNFQLEIHESYIMFLEILVEQFAAISYGDIVFGRQIAVYLHGCSESPVRLAVWNLLANARVLDILPPLGKCIGEAEGYLKETKDDENILEAYVKSWVSGALDRAATRGSMAFILVLHHLSSFIFSHTNQNPTLRNKLVKTLLRDYSQNKKREAMMMSLVQYHHKENDLRQQNSAVEKRLEILAEACEKSSSLLTELENLKSVFVK